MDYERGDKSNYKNWLSRWTVLTVGLILLVLIGLAVVAAQRGQKPSQKSSTAGRSSQATSKPTPTPVKLTSATDGVVLDRPGAMGTKQFTAVGEWGFDWSYDCSKLKVPSNFLVSVYDKEGHVSTETPPVIEFGPKGSGTKQYTKPGTYFLGVNTKCDWHITAKANAPQP